MHFCDRLTNLPGLSDYSTLRLRARNIKIILQKKNLSFSHLPLPSKYQEEERRYLEERKRLVLSYRHSPLVFKLTARFKMRSLPLFHQILLVLHFLKAIKKIQKKSVEPFLKKSIFSLSDGKSLFLAKTDGRWLSFLNCSFFLR